VTERWRSEICTSQCLILWATVLEMVSNTELTSRATTGPWAYGWGVKTKTSLSSAKGKGREEYDEDIRCVTSSAV